MASMSGDGPGNASPPTRPTTQSTKPPNFQMQQHRPPWESKWMSVESKRWTKRYRTEVAASCSSLVSTFMAYPLDSIKTRMQAYKFDNVRDCFSYTFKTEGYNGFFRGVLSPLASITLVRTVSFSIYQKSKYKLDDWILRTTGKSPLVVANTKGALPTFGTVTCFGIAGAVAGAAITVVACPFELTKLSSQISVLMNERSNSSLDEPSDRAPRRSVYKPEGTMRTAMKLVRARGIGGLYAGFHLHLLRDTIGTGVYFMSYESLKQLLANARGNSPTSPLPVVVAGGCCGLASWLCIYPIDSAKSIYQRNYLSRGDGAGEVKSPKISFSSKRMYRGLGVSIFRSCLVNAIFFSAFEFIKKRINRLEVEDPVYRKPSPSEAA